MQTDERIAGQQLYYKSSESMSELADSSVDAIVTSPPYNRGKVYTGDDQRGHDDKLPKEQYRALLSRVFGECARVLAPSGVFFLNIGDSARDNGKSQEVLELAVSAGFQHLQTVIWVKSLLGRGHFTPSGGARRLNNLWENIYILVRDARAYRFDTKAIGIPYVDKSNIGRYGDSDLRDPGNVWLMPYRRTTGQGRKKGHAAPFPPELPWRCIKLVPGARRILDPFAGTGATLAACRLLGVEGIGYELYPRRSLIRETIERELDEPKQQALLPHLELAVAMLTELVEEGEEAALGRRLKNQRGRSELGILVDLLCGLGLGAELRERVEASRDSPGPRGGD